MLILRSFFLLLLLLLPLFASAQLHEAGGYCSKGFQCTLPVDNPAHFDPFYNSHLCEQFNPKQADFSTKYHALRVKAFMHYDDRIDIFQNFDCNGLWLTGNGEQNGVLGEDYTRIRFHFSKAERSQTDPAVYIVAGKSNVKGNICYFKGEIKLVAAYFTEDDSRSWHVFYRYRFSEDSTQHHAGIFQGMGDADVLVDKNSKVSVDEAYNTTENYENRNFVGTWTMYGSKRPMKCIWGDYRLPFTFDFDCGEGQMHVCDKYVSNGWQSFNEGKEYDAAGGKTALKKKWWQ